MEKTSISSKRSKVQKLHTKSSTSSNYTNQLYQSNQVQQPYNQQNVPSMNTFTSSKSSGSDQEITSYDQLQVMQNLQQPKKFNVDQFFKQHPFLGKTGVQKQYVIDLKQAFDFYDADQEGSLDKQELRKTFQELGFKAKASLETMLQFLDSDGSNRIEFIEFVTEMTKQLSTYDNEEDIRQVFYSFDTDQSQSINILDLRKIAQEIGEPVDDAILQEMINQASSNGVNVTQRDFINIIQEGKMLFDQQQFLKQQEEETKKKEKKKKKKK